MRKQLERCVCKTLRPQLYACPYFKVNHVIFFTAPISIPNIKALAQIPLFEMSCTQDFQLLFSKGHNSKKGHNSDMKKNIRVNYFFKRNLYMKFHNPSIHHSKLRISPKSGKINQNFEIPYFCHFEAKFSKVNQVIYSSAPTSASNKKALAQILFEITCTQDFQISFSKGHNSEKGHNSDMTKKKKKKKKKKKYESTIFS